MRARTVSSGGISIGLVPARPAKDLVGENAPVAAIAAAVSPVCLRKSRRVLFIRGSRVWLTATELRNGKRQGEERRGKREEGRETNQGLWFRSPSIFSRPSSPFPPTPRPTNS